MRALLLSLLLVATLLAADTPLSAILIEGEGWQPATEMVSLTPAVYQSKKDAKGRWGVYRGENLVASAAEGETFGQTALSPKGGQLVVAVPSHHYLYTFQVTADGGLTAQEKCYALRRDRPGKGGSNVGNLVFDTKGRLFVAMPGGVQYFDEEMRFSGQLSRPVRAPVEALGLKGNQLHIQCGGKVWKRTIKATGAEPPAP